MQWDFISNVSLQNRLYGPSSSPPSPPVIVTLFVILPGLNVFFLGYQICVRVTHCGLVSRDCLVISTCDWLLYVICLHGFLCIGDMIDVVDEQEVVEHFSLFLLQKFLLQKWSFVFFFEWIQEVKKCMSPEYLLVFDFFIEWTACHVGSVSFFLVWLVRSCLLGVKV